MNLIKNIIEPKRLLLAWQPDKSKHSNRNRRIVAEIQKVSENEIKFVYLSETDDFKNAMREGLAEYPHFFPSVSSPQEAVPSFIINILRRIPSRKRPDFNTFLQSIRVDPKANISDFALLGYSGALLPGDTFSLIHPFDDADKPCELLIEIAGFRYYAGMNMELKPGNIVSLNPEPENPFDSMAIKIEYDGKVIGYVNRFLTKPFHNWLKIFRVSAEIEKIVSKKERPKVIVFVKVRNRLDQPNLFK